MGNQGSNDIDDTSIHLFMNEISTTNNSNPATKTATKDGKVHVDNSTLVSFSELMNLYNRTFNLQDNEADSFVPMQIERLLSHIAKVTLDNQRNNFDLRSHFIYPNSEINQFMNDLKKEPLNCAKDHPANILQEIATKYKARE